MNKKIFIKMILLFLMIIPISVNGYCSEEDIVRISKLANNITTSTEYNEETNTFSLTFLNLTNEFVIYDENNNTYSGDFELTINNIKSGNHRYSIYDMNGCFSDEILTKHINLPFYNKYYKMNECNNFPEYTYCSKWLNSEITYNTWKNKVDNYKISNNEPIIEKTEEETPTDKIREFFILLYVDNYYIFLPIIIITFSAIIYLKDRSDSIIYRKNKKEDITL